MSDFVVLESIVWLPDGTKVVAQIHAPDRRDVLELTETTQSGVVVMAQQIERNKLTLREEPF